MVTLFLCFFHVKLSPNGDLGALNNKHAPNITCFSVHILFIMSHLLLPFMLMAMLFSKFLPLICQANASVMLVCFHLYHFFIRWLNHSVFNSYSNFFFFTLRWHQCSRNIIAELYILWVSVSLLCGNSTCPVLSIFSVKNIVTDLFQMNRS